MRSTAPRRRSRACRSAIRSSASPDGIIRETVDRAGLWRVQTPQGFHFDAILDAHRAAAGRALTDDAAVAEAAGIAPLIVAGSERI
jgi:2-C-methyl-D-erythritol 4-phosphate cytidylyltransferase/2-C-methyl-D-erythritol 2,4-cyclodiphosphate synthase